MRKVTIIFTTLLMTISTYCQTKGTEPIFNFDFEQIESGMPIGWNNSGGLNYTISLDSVQVKKGKYSILIEFKEGKEDYKSLEFTIPNNYDGKKITLSGYIKSENITNGYAGLWMRIDPVIAGDNMRDRGVTGTTDWNKYEITLDLKPSETEQIVIGSQLAGNGKMWLDDLSITIDGTDIKDLKPLEKKVFPAEIDKEFDNGSQITNLSIESYKIENLKTLGLVWGFLKYYHPNIAKGNFNWDYELFRVLPKVTNSKNNIERDDILVKWINNLGQFEKASETKVNLEKVKIKPDLDWISNSNFSSELSSLLLKVQNSNRLKEHFYIRLFQVVGNPIFKNENSYATMKFPDEGFRILSLYRYWNVIQYYFPYKNLIEEDWKDVLEEFIPKIINVKNETEYNLTVLELITRVQDTHADIWSGRVLKKYFGLYFTAADISFIENKVVVTGFYNDAFGKETGLEIGDIITKINNIRVEDIVKDKLKHTPASNYPTKLRNIARSDLLRTNDSILNIEYVRNNKTLNRTLKTYSTKEINIWSKYQVLDTCFKLITKDIAYLNHHSLKRNDLPKLWELIQNTKGLILDLRNYPEDFPLDDLSGYLYPKNKEFVKFTNGSISSPGLFTFIEPQSTGKENKEYYKGKVVVLVNEITQSASEYHAMAYSQSPNAIIIGSTTAGADGNISDFTLPGGIMTGLSGIGVYYPDGRETQRIGIIPDIEVKPTIEGIKSGRDELIEKAIEVINKY